MRKIEFINPWTNESFGTIEETSKEGIKEAYKRSKEAFLHWGDTSPKERVKYLKEIRDYIINNLDYLTEGISKNTGKVYIESLTADILPTLDIIKYYEKNLEKFLKPKKVKTPLILFGKKSYVEYKPMGTVAVISPWNYPFQLSVVPVISALAAGNTVILKPSEVTAYVGILIEEMFNSTSLPKGVVQVLHGGKDVGEEIVSSKPDKIFFTGSVATGKKIMEEASKKLIPVELELGGKDAMIVFEDANIDRAVNGALWGAFTNCGQVCMSVERLYVSEKIYDVFIKKLKEELGKISFGKSYYDDIGSMTFRKQVETVKKHIEDAQEKGGNVIYGHNGFEENSMHISPTIITGVKDNMLLLNEETFGPILPIVKFKTEKEAINLVNSSNFGLSASVWTKDIDRAKRIVSKIVTGNCCINDVIVSVANPHLPFGGVKESGMGRYHSEEGIHTFCHQTSVIVDKGRKNREINWYPYNKEKYEGFKSLVKILYGNKGRFKEIFSVIKVLK